MSAHTPGPWIYQHDSDKRSSGYIRKPLAPVADESNRGRVYGPAICRVCGVHPIDVVEANARLIAAAPDLYEAAKQLLEDAAIDASILEPGRVFQLRRAIAKAEGRQS